MNTGDRGSAADSLALMAQIENALADMTRSLHSGCDVAPARRARLEGAMAFALDNHLLTAAELELRTRPLLGDCGALRIGMTDEGYEVMLTLWQRRAPVQPTTDE